VAIPVIDPQTRQVMGYTNGLGASLPGTAGSPSKRVHSQREVNGVLMNFYSDGSSEPAVTDMGPARESVMAWDGSKVVTLPPGVDTTALPVGLSLLPTRKQAEVGGAKTEPTKTGPREISSQADYDKLKPGETYLWKGKTLTKKA
jgi:hypothetical protein